MYCFLSVPLQGRETGGSLNGGQNLFRKRGAQGLHCRIQWLAGFL
jgi:hypothetical protein